MLDAQAHMTVSNDSEHVTWDVVHVLPPGLDISVHNSSGYVMRHCKRIWWNVQCHSYIARPMQSSLERLPHLLWIHAGTVSHIPKALQASHTRVLTGSLQIMKVSRLHESAHVQLFVLGRASATWTVRWLDASPLVNLFIQGNVRVQHAHAAFDVRWNSHLPLLPQL